MKQNTSSTSVTLELAIWLASWSLYSLSLSLVTFFSVHTNDLHNNKKVKGQNRLDITFTASFLLNFFLSFFFSLLPSIQLLTLAHLLNQFHCPSPLGDFFPLASLHFLCRCIYPTLVIFFLLHSPLCLSLGDRGRRFTFSFAISSATHITHERLCTHRMPVSLAETSACRESEKKRKERINAYKSQERKKILHTSHLRLACGCMNTLNGNR